MSSCTYGGSLTSLQDHFDDHNDRPHDEARGQAPEPELRPAPLRCRPAHHGGTIPMAEVACRFYPRGRCCKGDRCPFRHDPADARPKAVVQDDPQLVLHGPMELAGVLGNALLCQWRGHGHHKAHTHGFHSRKAVMNPLAVSKLLELLPGEGAIIDPFVGSGTTAVEVMLAGRAALGYDISALAVGIAKLHCWRPSSAQLDEFRAAIDAAVAAIDGEDEATIDWERANRAVQVQAETASVEVAGALWFVLSHEQSYAWPEWRRSRGLGWRLRRTADRFVAKLQELTAAVPSGTPNAQIYLSDARSACFTPTQLGMAGSAGADGVLTSPPYPAVYDYVHDDTPNELGRWAVLTGQQHCSPTSEKSKAKLPEEIGSKNQFEALKSSPGSFAQRWQVDTEDWLQVAAEQLRPDGRIAMLIGDNAGVHALSSIAAAATTISERSNFELRLLASASVAEDARRPWAAKKRNYRSEHTILLEKKLG